ncbi:MAG: tetratricopeptide repeat protein [Flavobacteriales bacterium]|nr:tetratricopeptide repeat protein [Flavobacteriales bacterium]
MKQTLLTLFLLAMVQVCFTQNDVAGKVVYYEGKVETGKDPNWTRVKINFPVKKNEMIKTAPDATAEIVWNNGTKTIVGPGSKLEINALLAGSTGNSKAATEGVFGEFMTVFKTGPGAKRTEEGGIRRSEADKKEKEDLYWKQDKPITFAEAFSFYESKDYGKAITALQAFINQQPQDDMSKYAMFALGHSYIMSNNNIKAKEIFQNFVVLYANDPLKADAEKVLALI